MKGNTGLAHAMKVLRAVMLGRTLDRHKVADILGTKPAAADRVMRALTSMPGVTVERGAISCDARYRMDAPNDVMVLAGAMALSLSRMFGGSAQAISMQRLLERLMHSARRRISDVDRKFFFAERGGEVALESPLHAFDEISQAVRDSVEVSATYTRSNGDIEELQLRPLTIVVYQHQLYILAITSDQGMPHPFRLARMRNVELGEHFKYPLLAQYNPQALFEHTFGVHVGYQGPIETVEVRLTNHWARYAQDHRWHKSQRVKVDSDACIVSLRVRVCPEVETWVMSFGEFGEVLAPDTLRVRVAQRFASACATYTASIEHETARTATIHALRPSVLPRRVPT